MNQNEGSLRVNKYERSHTVRFTELWDKQNKDLLDL